MATFIEQAKDIMGVLLLALGGLFVFFQIVPLFGLISPKAQKVTDSILSFCMPFLYFISLPVALFCFFLIFIDWLNSIGGNQMSYEVRVLIITTLALVFGIIIGRITKNNKTPVNTQHDSSVQQSCCDVLNIDLFDFILRGTDEQITEKYALYVAMLISKLSFLPTRIYSHDYKGAQEVLFSDLTTPSIDAALLRNCTEVSELENMAHFHIYSLCSIMLAMPYSVPVKAALSDISVALKDKFNFAPIVETGANRFTVPIDQ